jgi:NAD-dependent dihydropyrimidine dehydrogenase PreA subunit
MIIYFSGTGNSLTVAQNIATGLNEKVMHMNEAKKLKTINDSIIGFVFPVYNYDIPPMLKAIIEQLDFPSVKYSFGIITHGGDKGNTIFSLKSLMKDKGSDLHYHNDVLMPVNSRIMYGMLTDKIEERISDSKIKCDVIVKDINVQKQNAQKIRKKHLNAAMHILAETSIVKKYTTPKVNPDLCTNCGICQSVCPVNNISVINGKAFIGDHCEQCTTCMHWCPQVAIHYGKRKVRKEQQYHNPEIKLKDISLRN